MKLKSEQNTNVAREAILKASRARFGVRKIQADYEHGQWWITELGTGAQWSVCDASGPGSVQGFDFEQVTGPDE